MQLLVEEVHFSKSDGQFIATQVPPEHFCPEGHSELTEQHLPSVLPLVQEASYTLSKTLQDG